MAKKSEAKATVSLNAKPFQDGAKAAIKSAVDMSTMIKNSISSAVGNLAAVGIANALNGISQGFHGIRKSTISAGEELANLSARMGMTAKQANTMRFAMENAISFGEADSLIGKASDSLGKNAEKWRTISIDLRVVMMNVRAGINELMKVTAPLMSQLIQTVKSIDFVAWGKSAGEFIKPIIDGVRAAIVLIGDGKAWELFAAAGRDAFDFAIDAFISGLKKSWDFFSDSFSGAKNLFLSVASDFGAAFLDAIDYVLTYLKAGLESAIMAAFSVIPDKAKKFLGMEDLINDKSFDQILQEIKSEGSFVSRAADSLRDSADYYYDQLVNGSEAAKKIIDKMHDSGVFNLSFGSGQLKQLLKSADAVLRGQDARKGYSNANTMNPFYSVSRGDSLTAVGGGGGVNMGLHSILNESKQQTAIQKQLISTVKDISTALSKLPSLGFSMVPSF